MSLRRIRLKIAKGTPRVNEECGRSLRESAVEGGLHPARGRLAAVRVDWSAIAYSSAASARSGAGDIRECRVVSEATATSGSDSAQRTAFAVLATISVCHLLNDMM